NGERSTWRKRERRRAREEILEAASHIFAQSGYDKSSMKEIAGRAGISVGMLYNHFKGKEDIFRALLERYVNGLQERGDSNCSTSDPPLEQLRCRIRSAIEFYWENRNLVLIYLKMNPLKLEVEAAGWERTMRGVVADLLASAMEQGDLSDDDPKALAALIVGAIHRLLYIYVNEENEEAINSVPDIIDRIVLKPLRQGGRRSATEEEGR
ncbi:MAG: TetR/AcrR family transcriptional regulator, partial [Candidatus Krumholzibacteria bacterium]|nr:TetR/AcrR family transcriptional regulator [Candidatus Krumholzibacteria bacterium]